MKPLSPQARKELLNSIKERYQQASWQEKRTLVDGLVIAAGYARKYAISLLNRPAVQPTTHRSRRKCCHYDAAVRQALITLWYATNQICSKRLVPFLPELVSILERQGHLCLSVEVRARVLSVSAATVDRLLKKERQSSRKSICTTRVGNMLKCHIPIRTFADWDDVVPGFVEADLVAHCGGSVSGAFLNTLVLTDIATGWIECLPLLNKCADDVILGLRLVKELLPFPLLGIDTDNGSEFINHELVAFCQKEKITFTRSRSYKKNDQAHVEQKNGSVVRRLVGYDRFEGYQAWQALTELYSVLRLYVNFFQPSLKLISKERHGARIIKKYDLAKTPYQRTLASATISDLAKRHLTKIYHHLDPVRLLKSMETLQDKLWKYGFVALPSHSPFTPQSLMPMTDHRMEHSPKGPEAMQQAIPDVTPSDHRFYRSSKNAAQPKSPRTWRTRQDPFEHIWDEIRLQLELNPTMTATKILADLSAKYPQDFNQGHRRTLQRRMATWRKEQHQHEATMRKLLLPKPMAVNVC